jgi:hypothetical protein
MADSSYREGRGAVPGVLFLSSAISAPMRSAICFAGVA